MAAPTQPVQLGTQFMVNFSGAKVPSQTAGYVAKDGWKKTELFANKAQVEDYAGNVINRSGAGAAIRYSGTLHVPAGTVPTSLKPGDEISLQPVVNGEVTGTAFIACIESAPASGNRLETEIQISMIKEASMTYTVA
ncbi:MAG: hypothetical protein WC736_15325 [Gallionella sp.]|jgi:hypothetical protein